VPKRVKAHSRTTACEPITTAGEVFSDGTVIELVAGSREHAQPMLLLWNGRRAVVDVRVVHDGRDYEPSLIDPVLYRVMRLPDEPAGYTSVRHLFDGIVDLFTQSVRLPQSTAGLLGGFAMSTWLGGRVSQVLHLAMCGCDEDLGLDVLRLLHCVCRHSLLIGEITPAWLRNMPTYLAPTLLVNQTEVRPGLQRLMRASCYDGVCVPGNAGGVAQLYGPKAIFCPDGRVFDAVGGDAIKVQLRSSQARPISPDEQRRQEIADHFQPKLLLYRLRNFGSRKMREREIDVSHFVPAMQPCVNLFARCFSKDSKLARDAIQLLVPQDEEVRRRAMLRTDYAIIEILLGLLHKGEEPAVQVEKLTQYVNCLLQSRGELWSYTHEAIGRQLADMGIQRTRNGSGQRVILDRITSDLVHQNAQSFGMSQKYARPNCPDCKGISHGSSIQIM
jgi:hypothetical protein